MRFVVLVLDDDDRTLVRLSRSVAADLLVPLHQGEYRIMQVKQALLASHGRASRAATALGLAAASLSATSRARSGWDDWLLDRQHALLRHSEQGYALFGSLERALHLPPRYGEGALFPVDQLTALVDHLAHRETTFAAPAALASPRDDRVQQTRLSQSVRRLLHEHGREDRPNTAAAEGSDAPQPPGHVAHVDRMIEEYAPDIDIPTPVALEQARQNIQLRIALLQEFGAIDAAEVAKVAGSRAKNPATALDNWRRSHRVLVVKYKNRSLVPGFLLTPDGPDPLVRPVLQRLSERGASPWEAALWWVLPKWQLDGQRPVDLLLEARAADEDRGKQVQHQLLEVVDEPREYF